MPTQKSLLRASKLLSKIELPRIGSLLDVSCGTGAFLSLVNQSGSELKLFGIDVSAEALAEAKQTVQDATLVQAPAEQLPFDDNAFQVVICAMTLHHYTEPEKVLREINRILVKGGILYLMDVLAPNQALKIAYNIVGCTEPYHFETFYTPQELQALLERSGFEALKYFPVLKHRVKAMQATKL